MKYLKLFENYKFNFKTKIKDGNITISVFFIGEKIGELSMELACEDSGWYWFDGIITEEQYDDLFNGKMFIIIENIKVNTEHRNKGIGKELMNKAFEFTLHKTGAKSIVLNASPLTNDNGDKLPLDILIEFYKKLGFNIFKNQGKNVIMIKRL